MSLEGVTEEPHHNYSSFRVRGKIFVTIPPSEDVIHVFVGEVDREAALALNPEFIEKLFWGAKVVGLRVILKSAVPEVVRMLVSNAHEARLRKDASPKSARTSGRSARPS
jgi:hypothetical protein